MTQPQPTRIGDFQLVRKLGEGGMGTVYEARQAVLDRTVALKLLSPRLASDEAFVARFLREARATAALNHPHIVAGIDVNFADGHYYFAMEFVEGETLRARIKREGALEEKEVARIGAAVASALAHAHQAGIVHRDVKPENILLGADGAPKLADLGLAKAAAAGEDGSLTQSGTTVGTPHYIAPEQVRGEKDIDGRADLYALGCTLYHAATGKTPFQGEATPVLMVKHLQERIPHPQSHRPELSDAICAVIGRMVARDPKHRYQDAQQAADDLAALAANRLPAAKPLPPNLSNFQSGPKLARSTLMSARGERHSSGRLAPVGATTRRATTVKARGMSKGWLPWAGALGSVALLAIFLSVMLGGSKEPSRSMAKNGRATPPSVSNPPEPPPAAPAQPAPPATHPSSGSAPAEIPVPRTLPEEPAKTLPSGALFYRFDTQEALQRFERDFEVYAGSGNVSIQVDGRPVPHRWVGVREIKDGKLRLSFRVTEEVSAKWGMAPHDFKLAHRTWKGDWEYACRLEIPPATEQLVKSANAFLFFHLQTTHGVKTSGAMLKIPNHYTRLFGGLVVDKGDLSPNTETFSIPARLAKSMYRNHGVFDLRWIKRGAHLKCMIDGTEAYGGEIPAHLLERMDRYPVRIGFVIYPPQDHWLALESLYFGPPRDEAP